ncbi:MULTISPECIES: hypothetical protein [unclassified Variovorax]|uniref:hypothetical protein n=1 Tax=unclassified Variovorax TaxID=663243 RepID=UPI003F47C42F
MADSTIAARQLVCRYLDGRTMDPVMFDAMAWVVAKRLNEGLLPTLSATLCEDIDNQARASAGSNEMRAARASSPAQREASEDFGFRAPDR